MYIKQRTPMEKVIGESVKKTDRTFVRSYTEGYCEAITENYKIYHQRSMESMAASDPSSSYPSDELKRIKDGTANLMKFEGFQLPGGITMNGRQIYEDAIEEIQGLEEEARLIWAMPDNFLMG